MVIIQNIKRASDLNPTIYNTHTDTVQLELYVDAISELSSLTNKILGLPDSMVILAGSFAYDKTGTLAILDSTGTWNVVEE